MATKLEISSQKLIRLEKERDEAIEKAYSHTNQTNGQPMNDKRNGQAFFNKREQLESQIFNKMHEIETQKELILSLKEREFNKENYLTSNGGVATCVQNIDVLKERKQTADMRRKIKQLETIQEKHNQDIQQLTEKSKELIESGAVKLWEKQPIYYFVNGLRKVALIINSKGDFALSKKYPTKNEEEEQFVQKLLNVNLS